MEKKSLNHLNQTKNNPRIVTTDNDETLDRTLDEFGPMDGIIFNVNPDINELVGGNQRTRKFKRMGAEAVITHRFAEPTQPAGSVAYGYVDLDGERHPYREVNWDRIKHEKGVLLANQHAGKNDDDMLAERYHELLSVAPDALDELFITESEVLSIQDGPVLHDDDGPVVEDKPEREKKYSKAELHRLAQNYFAPAAAAEFVEWLP